MPTVNGIYYPGPEDLLGDLSGQLATMAQSIANASKVLNVQSLAELNGKTGAMYPEGMLATLTEVSDGLDRIAVFLKSNNGFWMLVTGARLINLETFAAAVNGYANIYTYAGTSFYDAASGLIGVWTSSTADYDIIQDRQWTGMGFTGGTEATNFGFTPAYKVVPGGVLLRGNVQRVGKNFNTGENVIVLPTEARPAASQRFTLTGASYALANVTVGADGYMTIYSMMNVKPRWFSLDGLLIPNGD